MMSVKAWQRVALTTPPFASGAAGRAIVCSRNDGFAQNATAVRVGSSDSFNEPPLATSQKRSKVLTPNRRNVVVSPFQPEQATSIGDFPNEYKSPGFGDKFRPPPSVVHRGIRADTAVRDEYFSLFTKPTFMFPTLNIPRRLVTAWSSFIYRYRVERTYNVASFKAGAMLAGTLIADCLVRRNYNPLAVLLDEPVFKALLHRARSMTADELRMFDFAEDDCYWSFIAYTSYRPEVRQYLTDTIRGETRTLFNALFVMYLVRGLRELESQWKKRPTPSQLLRHHSDRIIIANLLFTRAITPVLDQWQVTQLNYFQPPKNTAFMDII